MALGAFADFVDALLYDNARATALIAALLGAHVAVAIAALARRRIPRLMIGLNLAVAGVVLLYKASQYAAHPALIAIARDDLAGNFDVRLVLFEAIVALAAGFALARWRVAAWLSAAAFVIHALAAAALLYFMFTFRIDRLI
jgi:hypothetical protein